MEDLDLLRSDWKKNEQKFKKIPRSELYGMLHKKSSSTVKWILIVSIIEIVFWVSLSFLSDGVEDEGTRVVDSLGIDPVLYAISLISYGVLILFCILIYRAYRKIKVTDNARNLMCNILNIRKTVSYYIYFNLGFMVISLIFILFEFLNKDAAMVALFNRAEAHGKFVLMTVLVCIVIIVIIGIITCIAWFLYRIIYGLFLRKLQQNYEELKNLEA